MLDIQEVKPYGFMAYPFQLNSDPLVPPTAWKRPGFRKWIEEELELLADNVWPAWNATTKAWEGEARADALCLTAADLALMRQLAMDLYQYKSRHADGGTQEVWFKLEDDLFGLMPERHSRSFLGSRMTLDEFSAAFKDGGEPGYCGNIHLYLKSRLQRPRANQMAWWMGLSYPLQQLAWSAWSPSAISGHAFQGLMACCKLFDVFRARLDPTYLAELMKFAVDIGDRRVIAGVHYPSDNAMSWRVALDALKLMDIDKSVVDFASAAIRDSIVYKAMGESPRHRSCIDLVDAALT